MPAVVAWIEENAQAPLYALEDADLEELLASATADSPTPHVPQVFDSQEEEGLYRLMRPEAGRSGGNPCIQTQVHVSSLASTMPPESRCDFLLTWADGRRRIIEVDGSQHEAHASADAAYDADLGAAGVDVLRLPAFEVRQEGGAGIREAIEVATATDGARAPSRLVQVLNAFRVAHQLQATVLTAVRSGHLPLRGDWHLRVTAGRDYSSADGLLEVAVAGVDELIRRLANLWAVDELTERTITVTVGVDEKPKSKDYLSLWVGESNQPFFISDVILPNPAARTETWSDPLEPRSDLSVEDGEWFLKWLFGKETFWEGQWECVSRSIAGQDTLVLLPTGRGKSIAFQLSALLRPGPCIVVDPIISLMDDQIDNLKSLGIDRAVSVSGRTSRSRKHVRLKAFAAGSYKFAFISPERFQSVQFRETLRQLTVNSPVSLIAIDEAHCVSEWGHSFRTAYLNLGRTTREYCSRQWSGPPPLVGLTGTASRVVLKDVQRALGIQGVDSILTPTSFDRPELEFYVTTCHSAEKPARLEGIVKGMPRRFGFSPDAFYGPAPDSGGAGLIFCPHVNGPFGVWDVAEHLRDELRVPVETYSGSAPQKAAGSWEAHKTKVARDFKRNRVNLLACTNAFGMGIDKPNVRFTVHLGLPQTVEAFYQEAGRAGRDQKAARCSIILSLDDPDRSDLLLDPNTPIEKVVDVIGGIRWDDNDDVSRALHFHTSSFAGITRELDDIRAVLDELGNASPNKPVSFSWAGVGAETADRDGKRGSVEKAIHTLVTLGYLRDYTVDWAKREFTVHTAPSDRTTMAEALGTYGRAYQVKRGTRLQSDFEQSPEFVESAGGLSRAAVMKAARLLLEFIYQTVELARRRALSEMLQASISALHSKEPGQVLKDRVLTYLTQTDWDVRLDSINSLDEIGSDAVREVAEEVVSQQHARELRGAAVRQLSSYPDQPDFLLLRAFAEGCSEAPVWDRVIEDVRAAIAFGLGKYDVEVSVLARLVGDLIGLMEARGRDARRFSKGAFLAASQSRPLQRELCRALPEPLAVEALDPLLEGLRQRVVQLV